MRRRPGSPRAGFQFAQPRLEPRERTAQFDFLAPQDAKKLAVIGTHASGYYVAPRPPHKLPWSVEPFLRWIRAARALGSNMASPSEPAVPAPVTPDRLWAEQLASGLALIIALLTFMAFFHPDRLAIGGKVLAPDDLPAYGWAAAIGVVVQLIFHEAGTLLVAHRLGLPLRFRFFPFGAHATAILRHQPRRVWIDAVIGLAGPLTGVLVSLICAVIYWFSDNPFFLGMTCVGCFYNLFTLIPLLDLEGGWIAPAITPPSWLFGIVLAVLELIDYGFNLVLVGVVCFAIPRFVLLLRARAPRTDLACTPRQRWAGSLVYFVLVLALAYFASTLFENLPRLVRENMGD